jgi:hypothetical protein
MRVYSDKYAQIMNAPYGELQNILMLQQARRIVFPALRGERVNCGPSSSSEVYLVVCVLGELCSSFCIELRHFDVVGLFRNKGLQLQL